ncbi:hypothetical protein F5Y06DRAFT_296417 [Hypoxylon sp. FL0890]|nr:hypothetical protein F5Y06DRAFT_296417 [Hypoxylon sp. FL0890]
MATRHSASSEGDTDNAGLDHSDARKKHKTCRSSSNTYDDVCKRCLSVNWDEVTQPMDSPFFRNQEFYEPLFQVRETHDSLRLSSCRICRMISHIKPPSLDHGHCFLHVFSAAYYMKGPHSERPPRMEDSMLLGVYNRALLHRTFKDDCQKNGVIGVFRLGQHYNYGIRPMNGGSADLALMKKCLNHCRRNHGGQCVPRPMLTHGLRVIDCMAPDRSVIEAPQNCRYAALSYVWGSQSTSSMERPTSSYSQVVEDAISVANSMDIQYLWVDRHFT